MYLSCNEHRVSRDDRLFELKITCKSGWKGHAYLSVMCLLRIDGTHNVQCINSNLPVDSKSTLSLSVMLSAKICQYNV